ncbi:MAG: isoleucine--tRNA ligase [Candidatus Neptunochlamydia sp.]|nr:isoleucine--tRNA ligase [Candidatus Neptunochlamydia sp.]
MFENRKESFPEREERIQKLWEKEKVFKKSLENRKKGPQFIQYDGPPFATGLPHYGHLLAGTIKDVIPRYKTMKGYHVPRRFGWDTHGLPVEMEIEKALELSGAAAIEQFGIAKFNEECRSIVMRYSEEWKATVNRMGRWVDFEQTYMTMDSTFMETVWWIFGELWKKGLVYEGYKVMPFSAQLGTPLSNFEANLNYQDVDDPSITVQFPLVDDPDVSLLIWTTTPWTLPSNLAVMIGEKLDYVKVKRDGKFYIIGKARAETYFKEDFEIVQTFKGKKLCGKRYQPMFDYFVNQASPNSFTVIAEESVGEEEGTGLVHSAPAFGEVDFFACKNAGIELVCPVDQNGKFTSEIPDLEGKYVKDADKELIKRVKEMGRMFHQGTVRHRYPFCWRSDTPLIYKAVSTWFVAVEKIRDQIVANNEHIHWVPGHLKHGRFGKWLENARDWAISRNRYWGTPIPIWRSADGDMIIISSLEELEKRTGKKVKDLHCHHIDTLTFKENGEVYTRVKEVFDCWFESGSMPYAQNHYPFENEKETMEAFPADFIAEGLDQTRAWFYTLNILSTALFNKPAFKNVIVNGIILAEDGAKMSKRLKNYPEPEIIMNKYGADSIRLYLLHSPVVQADDLRFCARGVELVLRQFLIPLWNSYVFLATYANIYKWKPNGSKPKADIDRWILSLLQKLISNVEKGMDKYALSQAVEPFITFIDQLTNWYIRRNRSRFWADEETDDRSKAFQTLYTVLYELTKIAAPFVPFISEAIYQDLKGKANPLSIHLCDYPQVDGTLRDERLEQEMASVQAAVSMGHALRKEHKLKVRQPLPKAHLISSNPDMIKLLKAQEHLILDELNVKAIEYHSDEKGFVDVSIKPNFKMLGRRAGPLMKKVQAAILALPSDALEGGDYDLQIDGESFPISAEDILIDRRVKEGTIAATEGAITIALDTTLDETLKLEGLAREIVNKVNTQRRNQDFEVTDRIKMVIDSTSYVHECFAKHEDYIKGEVLATEVKFEETEGEQWDLNGESAVIFLQKR